MTASPTSAEPGGPAPSSRSEWRAWPVVLGAGVGMATSLQLYAYASSLLMPEIIEEFGWTRGQFSAVVGLAGLGAILHPLIGRFVDRVGVRPVVFTGTILLSLVFLGIAAMPASIALFFVLSVLKTTIAGATNGIPHTRAIASWFQVHRGLALSLALTILPLVGAIYVPLFRILLDAYGWRIGLVVIAAMGCLVGLPTMFFTLKERRATTPSGRAPSASGKPVRDPTLSGFTPKEGLRTPQFWVLVVAMILINIPGGGIMLHIASMIGEHGFDKATIALIISIYPLSIITGRLAGGYFLDRFAPPVVACIMSALPAVGYGAFMMSGADMPLALAAAAICFMGIQQGSEFDVLAFFVARYLGLKSYGFLYAVCSMVGTFSTAAGVFIFGIGHDLFGSYQPVLLLAVFTFPATGLCFLTMGRFPSFQAHHAAVVIPADGDGNGA